MMSNIVTVLGLVVFVYACYRVGLVLNRFKHRRFVRVWQPLIGIINGTVHEDPQGGGATSWLAGQWKGYTIHASMTPNVRSFGYQHHENRFAVGVAEQDGRANWRTIGRDVSSDDRALEEALRRDGLVRRLEAVGCSSAHFDRHLRYIFINEDTVPEWIPPPERFTVLLDLAVELARINAAANRR
jgi:hypothetical protein